MKPFAVVLLLAATAADPAGSQPADADMAKAVDGFYRAYQTFRPPAGVPDAATRKRFAPFVSPALDGLLAAAEDAQNRYEKRTQGRYPPLIEGDPFTPNFEGATAFSILQCARDTRAAHCDVSLSFVDGKGKSRNWVDRVELARAAEGWRVADIVYGDNGDAGGGGRLSETLDGAIAHGNAMKQ